MGGWWWMSRGEVLCLPLCLPPSVPPRGRPPPPGGRWRHRTEWFPGRRPFAAAVLISALLSAVPRLVGSEPPPPQVGIARLEVEPARVTLDGSEGGVRLLITGVTAEGDRRDLTREAEFESSDERLVRVRDGQLEPAPGRPPPEAHDLTRDFSVPKDRGAAFRWERGDRPDSLATLIPAFSQPDFPGLNQPAWGALGSAAAIS